MRIWKYPFSVQDEFQLELPYAAELLTIQNVRGQPCLYALVDPNQAITERHNFRIFGTGHELPIVSGQCDYLGTFQMAEGELVWHVFYCGRDK